MFSYSLDESDIAVKIAASLARRFEGCYLTPYLCPAGVPTIGIGCTIYENGIRVTLNDPKITKERAEELLIYQIKKVFLPVVILLCPNVTDPEKLAGLIDFAFNLGSGRLKTSTLRKRVNAGQWDLVPDEYRKWNKGGGKVLKGLTIRREADILPSAFVSIK